MLDLGPYYLGFLAVSVALFYAVPARHQNSVLTACSLAIIAWISWGAALVLGLSVMINHRFALKFNQLDAGPSRHRHLLIGIAFNVGILFFIKYKNGFNRLVKMMSDALEIEKPIPDLIWVLPLGISYYTFQAIGYQIEIYRKNQTPELSLNRLAVFFSFFPKLAAGPIERSNEFLPMLSIPKAFAYRNIQRGGRKILWGFFKFMFVGSVIRSAIDPILHKHSDADGLTVMLALVMNTIYIYAQFSGYTDVAIGSANLFGMDLRENFNRPFQSKSLTDFWRRWHMSLSTWVMEYVYKPLSMWLALRWQPGKLSISISVFISFFILGIWHGTSWSFGLFGLIQGLALAFEIGTSTFRKRHMSGVLGKVMGTFATLSVFIISTTLFREHLITTSIDWIVKACGTFVGAGFEGFWLDARFQVVTLMALCFIGIDHLIFKGDMEGWIHRRKGIIRWMIYGALIYATVAGSGIEIQINTYQGF